MKVLHLSSEKSWRGGEQQMAYLIEELGKLGTTSHVALRKHSAFIHWSERHAIPSIALRFKNDLDISSALRLKQYCSKEKFDLIHIHSARGNGIAFLAALVGNRVPLVLSRRVDFPLKNNFFSKRKYNHSSIKKIICVSEKIREIVSKSIKRPERCVTVHDGIDLHRFASKGHRGVIRKELGIGEDIILVGNVAALAPHKDYFTFLDSAKILSEQNPQLNFLIVGEGTLRREIEGRIAALGLKNKVFMLGFREDLENVYADLDVLLYSSKEEGLGSSLLDAMVYGVPIVSTDAGGIPEIVLHEQTGLTAPVKDAKRLADNVIRVINDKPLRNLLVSNGKEFVKNFSKEIMAHKTLSIYRHLIADARARQE